VKHTPLYILILLILFSACSSGEDIRIEGKFKSLKQGQFYAYSYSPEWNTLDTIAVQDGAFSLTRPASDTTIVFLQYPNFMETMIIGIPGKTIKVKGDARDLSRLNISGSEENELLSNFQKDIYKKSLSEKIKKAEDFIKAHPESYASLVVFQKYFLDTEKLDLEKIERYLQLMLKHAPNRTHLLALKARMNALLNCRIGKKLPAFKATTLQNKDISNNTFKGKWTLVSLWSTWGSNTSRPLAIATKEIRKHNYQIEALNICLNTDTVSTMSIIKRDSIDGYNVCDQKAWDSPLVKTFGVRIVPTLILVNKDGVIVERDIKEEDIIDTLKKYLN